MSEVVDGSRVDLRCSLRTRAGGVVPVSTGATGNTPSGAFRILNKIPASATYDGSVALPRFMRFHGEMGIHGEVQFLRP